MLEELKQKEHKMYYEFSIKGTDLSKKLYNISYTKLKEYCLKNHIPIHPNRLIVDPETIIKHKFQDNSIDISDVSDVPYLIDAILEGETFE